MHVPKGSEESESLAQRIGTLNESQKYINRYPAQVKPQEKVSDRSD